MKSKLLIIAFLLSIVSWGQATLPLTRTAWGTTPTGWTDNGVNRTTSFACSGSNGGSLQAAGKYYKVWFSGVPSQLTYSIKGSNPSTGSFKVQESPDGVTWSDVMAYTTVSGTTCINESKPLLSTSRYVQFILITRTSGNIDIDDVGITTPAAPVVTPATLTGLLTGTPYSYNIIASNSPTSYAIASGSLPTGLSLNTTTGAITGTPTVAGPFSITVTATNATGTSPAVTISFTVTAPAANDLCSSVTPLTVNAAATTANMTGATVTAPFTLDNDVWYSFTASCNGTHNITLTGFTGDMDIELYTGPGCPASTTFLDNSAGVTTTEIISNTLTSGTTYYVRVLSYNNTADTSAYTIQVTTSGTININNTGSPAASFINANTSNVVIMGFTTTPNCATSYSLTGVTITKSGTSTTSDISNLRIYYDANANGVIDGGETSVSGAGIALANSMVFTLTGQTGLTTTRNYLLVCDVALAAVNGNTIKASISLSTNLAATIVPTGPLTGTAIGNTQTISPPTCTSAVISSITPASGPEGTEVTINASSGNLAGGIVKFNGVLATVVSSSALKIVVIVPVGATSGIVTITDSQPCNANVAFTVITKDITSCQGGNTATDLFFSEVTDSNTGSLTYLEIYNGTGATVNLSPYSVKTANNGGATFSNTLNLSNVNLATGSIYVVALGVTTANACSTATTPGADGSYSNQTSGGGSVNMVSGQNDFIGLYKSGTLIDSWGTYGNASWAAGLIATIGTDGSDFRRLNTASPLPNATYSSANWNIIDYAGSTCANNDYSNIGTYNFLNGIPPNIITQPAFTANCKAGTITVTGGEGFVGGNSLAYQWYAVAPNVATWTTLTDTGVYSGTTTATLGISNLTGLSGYQFYCQVRESGATCYTASYPVKINDGSVTWNGTDWRDSNNAVSAPSLTKVATINATYNTGTNGSFDACSLIVNSTFTATIASNTYINIQNDLTVNGDLIVNDNGSLVQISDTGVNTGSITVNRIHTVKKFDYVYLASPVNNFPLTSVSPTTSTAHLWKWIPTIGGLFGNWANTTENMITGKGYIVRGPSGFNNTTAADYTASYRNVPNNGIVAVDVERGGYTGPDYPNPNPAITALVTNHDDNWNLVGNPYASAVDAKAFMTYNTNIEGVVRIWTHGTLPSTTATNPFYASFLYNYTSSDFILYNLTGPSTQSGYDGRIASGQGFFVAMIDGPADATQKVYFNNAMRSKAYDNSQFFRTTSLHQTPSGDEKSRIWLDLIGPNETVSRTLIGYVDGATLAKDRLYDAYLKFDSNQNFYSLVDSDALNIQGRPTPFDSNDKVNLGIKLGTANGTSYKIAIAAVDGLFENSQQPIYLEDKLLNVIHDLRIEPYAFTANSGRVDDRFVLRYTNELLSANAFNNLEKNVTVASNNNEIFIKSNLEKIKSITVYDVLGRTIYLQNEVKSDSYTIKEIAANQQALFLRIVLDNGQSVVKKMLF